MLRRSPEDDLVSVNELDPLGRHLPAVMRHNFHFRSSYSSSFRVSDRDVVVQVALISETKRCAECVRAPWAAELALPSPLCCCRLQTILSTHGIPTQTPQQVEPVKIFPPSELIKVREGEGEGGGGGGGGGGGREAYYQLRQSWCVSLP